LDHEDHEKGKTRKKNLLRVLLSFRPFVVQVLRPLHRASRWQVIEQLDKQCLLISNLHAIARIERGLRPRLKPQSLLRLTKLDPELANEGLGLLPGELPGVRASAVGQAVE
jgi:hypothetical protein